jgi:hypothetical protein
MPSQTARQTPKSKVAVQDVERWILARLRHQRFLLGRVEQSDFCVLIDLNQPHVKKFAGCRVSANGKLDRPVLMSFPTSRMAIDRLNPARVNIDEHVEFDGYDCSAQHRHVAESVDLHITAVTDQVLHGYACVAAGHSV